MERVVLNALAESLRLHQLIHICACGDLLPSPSGEVDPPLTQRTGGTVAAATPQIVGNVIAACCLIYLRVRRSIYDRSEPDWHFQEKPIHLVTTPSRTAMSLGAP